MSQRNQILISASNLVSLLEKQEIIIFDCRFYLDDILKGRKEFMSDHIPGAIYLDLANDLSSSIIKGITGRHPLPHPQVLASTLRAAGMTNKTHVVLYDQSNSVYASRAWWLMKWLGHENVQIVDGGYEAWKGINGQMDNQWTLPTQGQFQPSLNENLVVKMDDLHSLNVPLVDSREFKRYSGEYEPIDPVAGHIPGAICVPYMDNTEPSGKWKSHDQLKERFSIFNDDNSHPVFYCGSGVTACHNILGYKMATGKDARLYPGSWSEWINHHAVRNPN